MINGIQSLWVRLQITLVYWGLNEDIIHIQFTLRNEECYYLSEKKLKHSCAHNLICFSQKMFLYSKCITLNLFSLSKPKSYCSYLYHLLFIPRLFVCLWKFCFTLQFTFVIWLSDLLTSGCLSKFDNNKKSTYQPFYTNKIAYLHSKTRFNTIDVWACILNKDKEGNDYNP